MRSIFQRIILVVFVFIIGCSENNYGLLGEKCYPDGTCDNSLECNLINNQCENPCSTSCDGCCNENGECKSGLSYSACGSGGERCEQCGSNEECNNRQCINIISEECGCYDVNDECQTGDDAAACGKNKEICDVCTGDESCINGVCEKDENDENNYDCQSACDGCCNDKNECQISNKDTCGVNGNNCVPCEVDEVCSNGSCEKDCTSHYEERCSDGNVHWYDSCGEIEEISKTCTSGKVCENAECVCVSKQEKKCYDGNVYWYDSCDKREDSVAETCGTGTTCEDGSCEQCTGTRQKNCSGNSIYWYDACGEREEKVEDCQDGKVCSNATCICKSNYAKGCHDGDVYWFDSCGVLGSKATTCSSTQTCSNGSCVTDYSCSSWKDCAPFPDHVCRKSTSKCEKLSCATDPLRCRKACEQDIISCNFTIEASNMNCSSKSEFCCYFSVSFEGTGNCSAP